MSSMERSKCTAWFRKASVSSSVKRKSALRISANWRRARRRATGRGGSARVASTR
jgi:hypothetical protein